MQRLHGTLNLQNWYKRAELKEMYLLVMEKLNIEDEKYKKFPEPIVTCWWLVGACAVTFKQNMRVQEELKKGVLTNKQAGSASAQIASCTLGLMNKPTILFDVELICNFHEWF